MTMETTRKNNASDDSGVLGCPIIFTIVLFPAGIHLHIINLICHSDLSDQKEF